MLGESRHQRNELIMKIDIDDSARGPRGAAVIERPHVGYETILRAVAQRMPFLQEIEPARARAELNPHAAIAIEAPQHLGDAENASALVLIDEIKLGGGMQLTRRNGSVEIGDEVWPSDVAERRR